MIIYASSGVFNASGRPTSSFIYDESVDCFIFIRREDNIILKEDVETTDLTEQLEFVKTHTRGRTEIVIDGEDSYSMISMLFPEENLEKLKNAVKIIECYRRKKEG